MKKILIATDFSATAEHAAEYGYQLAKQLKASLFLCNTITIPAEVHMPGMTVWPQGESDTLLEESTEELKRLKAHLQQSDHTDTFRPPVDYFNEAGTVREIVATATAKEKFDLTIAGAHQSDGLSTFLLGNHINHLIESCIKPLLIIPATANFNLIKKIAFATDFEHPENDLEEIYKLIDLARMLDAEILLTHVYSESAHTLKFEACITEFLAEISNKANYSKIYYRIIKKDKIETGLDWLCKHGQIDILAMVHRKHDFLDSILNGSHTKKMARHINIPLLVYPDTKLGR